MTCVLLSPCSVNKQGKGSTPLVVKFSVAFTTCCNTFLCKQPSRLSNLMTNASAVGDLRRAHAQHTKLSNDARQNVLKAFKRDQRLRCFRHWPTFDSSISLGSVVGWDLLYRADKGMIDDIASPAGIASLTDVHRVAYSSTLWANACQYMLRDGSGPAVKCSAHA